MNANFFFSREGNLGLEEVPRADKAIGLAFNQDESAKFLQIFKVSAMGPPQSLFRCGFKKDNLMVNTLAMKIQFQV